MLNCARGASGRRPRPALTAAELLLTVAVVGILSAMLLPAFQRARESAGQAICISNVKAIAQAIRMYLADNDFLFFPEEDRPDAIAYLKTAPGGAKTWDPARPDMRCRRTRQVNPYLRPPVILQPYLPDLSVWRCPNAALENGAGFINGADDWLGHLKAHQGEWGINSTPYFCPNLSWPPGWGGGVTDTLDQRRLAAPLGGKGRSASPGVFLQSIGVRATDELRSTTTIPDPSKYLICGDAGWVSEDFFPHTLSYPDLCQFGSVLSDGWHANWEQCPWSRQCGAVPEMKTNAALRRPFARHFGGVNVGFLDGHARWVDSEAILSGSEKDWVPGY